MAPTDRKMYVLSTTKTGSGERATSCSIATGGLLQERQSTYPPISLIMKGCSYIITHHLCRGVQRDKFKIGAGKILISGALHPRQPQRASLGKGGFFGR
jgi:hypothetical protein